MLYLLFGVTNTTTTFYMQRTIYEFACELFNIEGDRENAFTNGLSDD